MLPLITYYVVRQLIIQCLPKSLVKFKKTPPITTSPLLETASKRSPFTRFLLESRSQERKSRGDKNQERAPTLSPPDDLELPEVTQEETGENRIERLLNGAAEEATEKMKRTYFTSEPTCSKTILTEPVPEVQPSGETPTPTTSKVVRKNTDQSSDSGDVPDSDSSSELSSCEDLVAVRERTMKRQGKRKSSGESPPQKRAKPRSVLAGWMYHKYPILKFFVTAPSDAARYSYKYRCRVCLIELSLLTKGPIEILHHYRTDAHLVKEHRKRMENPGLPSHHLSSFHLSPRRARRASIISKWVLTTTRMGYLSCIASTQEDMFDTQVRS